MKAIGMLLVLLGAASTGCRLIIPADGCSAVFKPALSVRVQDSASGAMAASGAQLVVHDGAYTDSGSFPANHPELDSLPLEAGGERAGTYTVTIRKIAYRDWAQTGVAVTKGECHVNTVTLNALLQRS